MAPPSATADLGQNLTSDAVNSSLLTHGKTVPQTNGNAATLLAPSQPHLAELDASRLTTVLTSNPKPITPGSTTDHMITCIWNAKTGWAAPSLRPYSRLPLWPQSSCLHYATECFEGMKAYRGIDGKARLFRPSLNAARMLVSSTRISCPSFPPSAFEELVKQLLAVDGPKWLKDERTYVYIRPTMIGTGQSLGVGAPGGAIFFIIMTMFPKLDNPMKLLASSEDAIRAWPGGFGYAKVGANYGPSFLAQAEANKRGYNQILWLFGEDAKVTEAGASNFFVVMRSKAGVLQLVTAPLDDKIILPGVTRRSILEISREKLTTPNDAHVLEPLEIVERTYTMPELAEAHAEGRLLEAFAAGTAFFIAGVTQIHFRGSDIFLPALSEKGYTATIKKWIGAIMYGEVAHEWGVVVPETGVPEVKRECAEVESLVARLRELRRDGNFDVAMEKMLAEEGWE